jgi:hypothetical protein
MEQSWLFVKADVLALVGQRKRAFAQASKALALNPKEPLIGDFSGAHARWTAVIASTLGDASSALATVERISSLSGAHTKDRAEALASLVLIHEALGLESATAKNRAREELGNLPGAVTTILCRLGLTWIGENTRGGGGLR